MNIAVNGKTVEVTGRSLSAVLEELGHGDAIVATAVNEVFVPVTNREAFELSPGDRLEIVAPRQGG